MKKRRFKWITSLCSLVLVASAVLGGSMLWNKHLSAKAYEINLENELEIKNDRIKELEQKVEQMQLADAFTASTDDVKEAKKRIGKIVREIDKCISMLND